MIQHSIHITFTPPSVPFINPIRLPFRHSMDIKLAVCRAFNISMRDLIGHSKEQRFSRPRCAAYYLMKRWTGLSYTQIAQSMGRTDHSTVISGVERAKALLGVCPEFAEQFERAAR